MAGGPLVRLSTGLGPLGYVFLPEATLDAAGNMVFPSEFAPPESWNEATSAMSQLPLWNDIMAVMRLFTLKAEPSFYRCWKAAIKFDRQSGEIHIALVKAADFLADQRQGPEVNQSCLHWVQRFHKNILIEKIQPLAGSRPAINQNLLKFASSVVGIAQNQTDSYPEWNRADWPDLQGPDDDGQKASTRLIRVKKLQSDKFQVSLVLELASRFISLLQYWNHKGLVRAMILWYDPNLPNLEWQKAYKFSPLRLTQSDHDARTISYWWNTGSPPTFQNWPFVWSQKVFWRHDVTDVPIDPVFLANNLYPEKIWNAEAPEAGVIKRAQEEERKRLEERRRDRLDRIVEKDLYKFSNFGLTADEFDSSLLIPEILPDFVRPDNYSVMNVPSDLDLDDFYPNTFGEI